MAEDSATHGTAVGSSAMEQTSAVAIGKSLCVSCGWELDELDRLPQPVMQPRYGAVAIGANAIAWNGPVCRYCRERRVRPVAPARLHIDRVAVVTWAGTASVGVTGLVGIWAPALVTASVSALLMMLVFWLGFFMRRR